MKAQALAGMELRKAACEALGWTILRECAHPPGMEGLDPQGFHLEVPAIESDPAVSEPMFLRWCEKSGFAWRLSSAPHRRGFTCAVWRIGQSVLFLDASTPSEARARAITAGGKE